MHQRPAGAGCALPFVALAALLLSGCATYRLDVPKPASYALPARADSALAQSLRPALDAHPGQSALALLQYGSLAFLSRAALADLAERSIDVQYYIYETDDSGVVLADRLIAAARRGVRVRLLVDDNNLVRSEDRLATLAGQPNFEIRVFNPYRNRVRWMRPFEFATSFGRVQRRMHNKIFAVDGELAVIGGRNIGDNYFDLHRGVNFSDLELLAAGPVAQVADVRESYGPVLEEMRNLVLGMQFDFWGEAELVADPPEKIDESRRAPSPLLERVYGLWRSARSEVLLESAYLVPLRAGADLMAERARAGVRVALLTNSLASTDVVPVHAGYAKRRRELLAAGVELYEFQAEARRRPGERRYFRRMSGGASLHSKVMVIDRTLTWVGSFNIDPRSALINTELAVLVRSPKLAEATAQLVLADLAPDRAWRLSLEPPGKRTGRLFWTGERDGQSVRLTGEPGATHWQRFVAELMRWIPGLDHFL